MPTLPSRQPEGSWSGITPEAGVSLQCLPATTAYLAGKPTLQGVGGSEPLEYHRCSGACCQDQFVHLLGTPGACWRDQFIPLLGFIWSLLSGPLHPSSGVHLEPAVGTSSSLLWGSSGVCCQDQFIPLLGFIWVGPDRRLELSLQCLPSTTAIHPGWKADPIRVSLVCHPHTNYNSDSKLFPILIIIFWFWHSYSITATQFRHSKSDILILFYVYLFLVYETISSDNAFLILIWISIFLIPTIRASNSDSDSNLGYSPILILIQSFWFCFLIHKTLECFALLNLRRQVA